MISVVRGTRDLYGDELATWHRLEDIFRTTSAAYGYNEFRTPILEHTELFKRGVGENTDIVGKEMYTFDDRGGDSLTMRPEMTAPIVRAAIEHNLVRHSPVTRLWYAGPLFRYERPQKGRFRQFHQYGAECLGSPNPEADAEVILLAYDVLRRIGVTRFSLEINSLGTADARAAYRAVLVDYLERHAHALSEDSQRRITSNPLRVLDSKAPEDRPIVDAAPRLVDHLDADSIEHFTSVRTLLDVAGIPYTVNPLMVRGLDYYSHTVFEFTTDALGSQNAICGGGRYDPLFALVGGTPTPAVGFSIGIERVVMLLEAEAGGFPLAPAPDVYVVAAGDDARLPAALLAVRLRRAGLSVHTDLLRRSVKGQMKEADRLRSRYVVTLGDDELKAGTVQIKNMADGSQTSIAQSDIVTVLAPTP